MGYWDSQLQKFYVKWHTMVVLYDHTKRVRVPDANSGNANPSITSVIALLDFEIKHI
jgi:hypothetical protein